MSDGFNERGAFQALALASVMGPGAALQHMEQQGLEENRREETLPSAMSDDRATFEKMGIVFHEKVPGDPMFTKVTLPPGWRKEHTGHSMYLDLLDEQGRKRASIFYKSAFYDRSARMSACRRYSVAANYGDKDYETFARAAVRDGETEIWTTERVEITEENRRGVYNRETHACEVKPIRDQMEEKAVAWLDENRPGWDSPLARWDDPPPVPVGGAK